MNLLLIFLKSTYKDGMAGIAEDGFDEVKEKRKKKRSFQPGVVSASFNSGTDPKLVFQLDPKFASCVRNLAVFLLGGNLDLCLCYLISVVAKHLNDLYSALLTQLSAYTGLPPPSGSFD